MLNKHVDFGLHALTGNGVGRYGTGGLPDATVNPDGTLGTTAQLSGLGHTRVPRARLDFYMNVGEEYVKKRWQQDPDLTASTLATAFPACGR